MSDAAGVPVTCKIRSGFDEVADVERIAKTIEQNGAAAIAVHPRTRKMYYSGHSDWNIIADVKNAVSIPVIGNGDINCAADAKRMLDTTGCDAVMIGRGARGNPFIFREVLTLLRDGKTCPPPTVDEKMNTLKKQINMLCNQKGEYIGIREARKHVAWYIKSLPDSAAVRNDVCKTESLDALMDLLNNYSEFLKNG